MIVVLVIVLLLFGAKKLPELARGMGQMAKSLVQPAMRQRENLVSPAPKPSDSQN